MQILLFLVIGTVFAAFAALVFSGLTLLLGIFWEDFEVSGPGDWSFSELYLRYLIIAGVYTFVSLPLGNGFLGIAALAIAFKYVFDAGWVQAIVIGFVGGTIAFVLFVILAAAVLKPFELMDQTSSNADLRNLTVLELTDKLSNSDPNVRWSAAFELGRREGTAVAIPNLIKCLEDENVRVRRVTTQTLGAIVMSSSPPYDNDIQDSISALRIAQSDSDEVVRDGARIAITAVQAKGR